jgi:hypothetical protein
VVLSSPSCLIIGDLKSTLFHFIDAKTTSPPIPNFKVLTKCEDSIIQVSFSTVAPGYIYALTASPSSNHQHLHIIDLKSSLMGVKNRFSVKELAEQSIELVDGMSRPIRCQGFMVPNLVENLEAVTGYEVFEVTLVGLKGEVYPLSPVIPQTRVKLLQTHYEAMIKEAKFKLRQ